MVEGIMLILLFVSLMGSGTGNFFLGQKLAELKANPTVKIEYREIEVPIQTTNCECGHPSSMHIAENTEKPSEGGCQQEFFELQGKKTTSSFKCFCVRYAQPSQLDDLDRQLLMAKQIKEIG